MEVECSPFNEGTAVPHCSTLHTFMTWVLGGFADLHHHHIGAFDAIKGKMLEL